MTYDSLLYSIAKSRENRLNLSLILVLHFLTALYSMPSFNPDEAELKSKHEIHTIWSGSKFDLRLSNALKI